MKTVFITGAAHNTGYSIAEKYAENGYNVAVSSRSLNSAADAANRISEKYNVKTKGYEMKLTDVKSIADVFDDIEKTFGGIDVFVGNAANLAVDLGLLNSTEEDYYNVTDANIKGNFFCCKYAAEIMMKKHKGSIVIIGSVHNKQTIQGRALYTVSKGALLSMVRSAALELGAFGIRANYIAAGGIHTDRWDSLTDEAMEKKRSYYPIGIESTGEDIANCAFYLGTDLSKTVTGTELTVDSGVTLCLLPFTKPNTFKEK